jgi:lysylphosphatidylglycerol synthetase-like protein (DUF2156 family)
MEPELDDPLHEAMFAEAMALARRNEYQRVALRGIVLSGVGQTEWERSILPTATIPYHVMCRRLLEWNDGPA